MFPVVRVEINVFEAVSMMLTDFELPFVTKTRLPLGVAVTQFGATNPLMVVKRFPEASCTVTTPALWFETYTFPFGNTVTPLGPAAAAKVFRTVLEAVLITATLE